MIEIVVGALLPAVITLLLGYFSARHHDFGLNEAQILNRMVLTYALPLSVFVAVVKTTRTALAQALPLVIVLAVAIIGVYGVVFLASRYLFRLPLGVSALAAFAASAPNAPYVGPAVLGSLYGPASGIPIAVVSMVAWLSVAPATMVLLSLAGCGSAPQPAPPLAGTTALPSSSASHVNVAKTVLDTAKQPLVWLPALAFIIVISGLSMPPMLSSALELLGQAAAGVALFAAGILLASFKVTVSRFVLSVTGIKNIVQPALVWAALLALGYTGPLVGEAVVTTSLLVWVLVVMLAVQYETAETETASTFLISTVGSIITTGAFIVLSAA
jgi:malonate transporter